VVAVSALAVASAARGITITYVNPGPLDSRVFVGFDNDASGNLTSDFVSHSSAASRNDTVSGPLPPIGMLPSFDAMAYASAELGTNLNAPLGTGVRSVFAPLNPTFMQAHGETLAGSGSYSSHAFSHSGDTTSTTPMHWTVHVDPSGTEVAGTPADVTVTGTIAGQLTVAGTSIAAVAWNVATTAGTVIANTLTQSVPGTTNFSDTDSLTFTLPLGSTFELLVDYDLTTSGSGAGADSTSEITSSLVQISAVLTPPMMMFAPVSGAKLLMVDQYAAASKAKVVLLIKDQTPGAIAKGAAAEPPGLSGTVVLYQLADPTNRAIYDLGAAGWLNNKPRSAKFVNAGAAPGGPGAKVASVKPDKLIKLVARNLGDGDAASGDQSAADLDLSVLTPSDAIVAVLTIQNAADSSTHTMCAQFNAPVLTPIGGGSGVKYLSKTSSLPTSCDTTP
jgi:hypothetical protein